MIHKTLKSYHKNEPYVENQDHPDGPLWLISPEEYRAIPPGVIVEHCENGLHYKIRNVEGKDPKNFERTDEGYMVWGIRGR